MRYPYAPRWVNAIYLVMEWVDYHIISEISSWLLYRREELLDRYCHCEYCKKRAMEAKNAS